MGLEGTLKAGIIGRYIKTEEKEIQKPYMQVKVDNADTISCISCINYINRI